MSHSGQQHLGQQPPQVNLTIAPLFESVLDAADGKVVGDIGDLSLKNFALWHKTSLFSRRSYTTFPPMCDIWIKIILCNIIAVFYVVKQTGHILKKIYPYLIELCDYLYENTKVFDF